MQIHLNKGVHRNGTRIYQSKTVEQFYTREDGLPYDNRRALGWEVVMDNLEAVQHYVAIDF